MKVSKCSVCIFIPPFGARWSYPEIRGSPTALNRPLECPEMIEVRNETSVPENKCQPIVQIWCAFPSPLKKKTKHASRMCLAVNMLDGVSDKGKQG